jgi:hypothetical protein
MCSGNQWESKDNLQLVRYVSEGKRIPVDCGRSVGGSIGIGCKCR